nr:putative feruloyl esterase b-2 [Quercus suber]
MGVISSTMKSCPTLCSSLVFPVDLNVSTISCQAYRAGSNITITGGQASVGCGTTFSPDVDICRAVLSVRTSYATQTYMEVWLPNNNASSWNGRTMSTDNGGMNGCVHYVDMKYVSGLGYAAIGDNAGHNSSSFDGSWTLHNNEEIIDWSYRSRHSSVQIGKAVTDQFYGKAHTHSYYIGCSAGGAQALHSAQYYPNDFDGIIAGSPAADFNHLQDWSARFVQLTGFGPSDPRFLTQDQWIFVQSQILSQCDAVIDGVNDGILEDPTLCRFNATPLTCTGSNTANCLTDTQTNTVTQVFSDLFNSQNQLLFPALLYGSQVDAYRLGQLSGSIQGIARDWFRGGVHNASGLDITKVNQTDYTLADELNNLHGDIASFGGDLSAFRAAGKKLMIYHGLADPLVTGTNSQRYYLKVANNMTLTNTQIDDFMRFFRISGMSHCGVDGISGAGAWMFGQSLAASAGQDNIISNLVNWVENNTAPDTLLGTKFYYDTPSFGVQFTRRHCRFPYRTTYSGNGDSNNPNNWSCVLIQNWQTCGVGAHPRLCNADGSFT